MPSNVCIERQSWTVIEAKESSRLQLLLVASNEARGRFDFFALGAFQAK